MSETLTSASGIISSLETKPYFRVVKTIPDGMSKQIEGAVVDFIKTSHMPKGIDLGGFYQQTLSAIANATYMGGGGDFWIGTEGNELTTYVLAHVTNDYDGRLNYFVSQAWVRKDQRGKQWVKEAWESIRKRAKDCFCKHLSITSTRENDSAYCRFLGGNFSKYASILKDEI